MMLANLIQSGWAQVTLLFNKRDNVPPADIPSFPFPPPRYTRNTPARAQQVSTGHTARASSVMPIHPPPYTHSCDTLPLYTPDPHYPINESSRTQTRVLWIFSRRGDSPFTPATPYNSTRSSSTALPGRLRRSELVHPHVKRQYVLVMAGICAIAVVLIVIRMKRNATGEHP